MRTIETQRYWKPGLFLCPGVVFYLWYRHMRFCWEFAVAVLFSSTLPPEHSLQESFWTVTVVTSSTNFYKPMSPFRSPPGKDKQPQNCVNFLSWSCWLTAHAHQARLHWLTARADEAQLRWLTARAHKAQLHWQTACAHEAQLHWLMAAWQHLQMKHNFIWTFVTIMFRFVPYIWPSLAIFRHSRQC